MNSLIVIDPKIFSVDEKYVTHGLASLFSPILDPQTKNKVIVGTTHAFFSEPSRVVKTSTNVTHRII
jgi:hypothetical protein